jgi:hypothetical protein
LPIVEPGCSSGNGHSHGHANGSAHVNGSAHSNGNGHALDHEAVAAGTLLPVIDRLP